MYRSPQATLINVPGPRGNHPASLIWRGDKSHYHVCVCVCLCCLVVFWFFVGVRW